MPDDDALAALLQRHDIPERTARQLATLGADLRERTRREGIEFGAMLDTASGNAVGRILAGTTETVVIDSHISAILRKYTYIQLHTYPLSMSFSPADVSILIDHPGPQAMIVTSANGDWYAISRTAAAARPSRDTLGSVTGLWRAERGRLMRDDYAQLVNEGNLTHDEAVSELSHLAIEVAARRSGLRYDRLQAQLGGS